MTNPKASHQPIMVQEIIDAFMAQPRPPVRFFEGTFGRGGHTRALLRRFPQASVVSFDRDTDAVAYAREAFHEELKQGRLHIIHDDFRNMPSHKLGLFDGALIDLGVSSPQLDDPARGFSFTQDGPLDMRMDQKANLTAGDIINSWSEKDLLYLFQTIGEIRNPRRVLRAVVHDRKTEPFATTRDLASLIERVEGWNRRSHHPATSYFLALRIAVNGELDALEEFCQDMAFHLEPGSRLAVIAFHSLEDRPIKTAFRSMHKHCGHMVNKKVIVPSDDEIKANPRARSARLRIFQMGGAT